MIIESGVIVALGLLFTFLKCSWRVKMKMLSHPLAMDLGIFVLLCFLHWGSFYGIMAATCGAMITSAMISFGRWLFGYIEGTLYFPGVFNIANKIMKELR